MKRGIIILSALLLVIVATIPAAGCRADTGDSETIVVTHSILGSIVKELVGNSASVTVLMPNGVDPHDWEPSAHDIQNLNNAELIIWNGLELEVSIEGAVNSAVNKGVKLFTATNHIEIRHIDEAESAPDPHFWLDPLAMKNVVTALAAELKTTLNINTDTRARALEIRLDDLHNNIVSIVSNITPADRKLVTGHDSMGYFTQRYGFQLIGSVVPNLSTQAGVSAADIAALIAQIKEYNVKAIFVESGTSVGMVQQISNATGAAVVELSPIMLPPDGSYFTFMSNLAEKVVNGLK